MLADKELKEEGAKLLSPFKPEKVQAVGYDLTTSCFYSLEEREADSIDLQPMESVFVRCVEEVQLPLNMVAQVALRNSRIRQGLLLTAPIYHPGHKTPIYFRITNVSSCAISLKSGCELATLVFERLAVPVLTSYEGSFQEEDRFRGMASYKEAYGGAMKRVEQKIEDLRDLEKRVYTNVLSILAIFVAIFSIINVNVSSVSGDLKLVTLVVLNLCVLGAIGFLLGIIKGISESRWLIGVSVLLLLSATCVALLQ